MKKDNKYYDNLIEIANYLFSDGMENTKDETLIWIRETFNYSEIEANETLLDVLNIMDKCLNKIDEEDKK